MPALRLGLIPRGDATDERERAFVRALGEALRTEVDVHRAADYRVVLTGMKQQLVDFAWLPPLVAARAVRERLGEPVAVTVRYGDTSYSTALVARPGSRIRTVRDLRAVRVAWVDRESASGYAVLRAALAREGVLLADAFADETFVRSHAAVARAVLDGEVDVGATCAHAENGVVRFARSPYAGDAGLSASELHVVFEAGPIPSDIFAVRTGVPPHVRSTLEAALLHARPERVHATARALVHADGFAVPTLEHARMLEALIGA
jgi:phosphate/phosphite/phosphonate ABC transporter binding protein